MAKECNGFLEKVEQKCPSASDLSTLQMYEERLCGEFSTVHFQAVKAKACAVGPGASGAMRAWNAAWLQCQQLRQHLEEMHKRKKFADKKWTTAANTQAGDGRLDRRREKGRGESSLSLQEISETKLESTAAAMCNHYYKEGGEKGEPREENLPHTPFPDGKTISMFPQNGICHPESKWRPREHHSEADLRSLDSTEVGKDFLVRQPLGRSLSEGSYAGSQLTSTYGFPPLNVRNKHCQSRTQPLELNLQPIHILPVSHNESLRSGNLSGVSQSVSKEEEGKGSTAFTQSPEDLRTPETLLTATDSNGSVAL